MDTTQPPRSAQRVTPAQHVQTPRMSRRRPKPLIRSAGIRFAVVYAIVFGVSAFVLAFSLWYSTVGLLQRQVEFAIRSDAIALNESYLDGGVAALDVAIRTRLADADR